MYVEVPEYAGPLAFFKRHYNGDYSLGRSYWVNNTLVAWFAPLLEDMSEAELAAVASKEARDKDLNAACSAGVKYLGAINRLPVADKARTMRVLYSGN